MANENKITKIRVKGTDYIIEDTITLGALNNLINDLGSAAYEDSTAFDTAGAAATAEQNAKAYTYSKSDIDSKDTNTLNSAKDYAKEYADSLVTSVLKFKGTKATEAEVKAITKADKGDLYLVTADNSEWLCIKNISSADASAWERLGTIAGTVTSVAIENGGGIGVSGSPITSSGTITITNAGVRSITQDSSDGHKLTINTNGTNTPITIPDDNTTYTLSEGSNNGTISVKPSDGLTYSVSVHGLGSAAYTDSADYEPKFTDGSASPATVNSTAGTITIRDVSQSDGKIGNGSNISGAVAYTTGKVDSLLEDKADKTGTYPSMNVGYADDAGTVNTYSVECDVPSDAVFTDTTYTDGEGIEIDSTTNAINVLPATEYTFGGVKISWDGTTLNIITE